MNDTIRHRGPDAEGTWISQLGDRHLALAHRRLAILDLSPLGHQPMITDDGAAAIVFNGEIYNFLVLRKELESEGVRFRSQSDTEVLLWGLKLHGKRFVEKLEGMYAFAFVNRSDQSLLLARDPMGIKPLYYVETQNDFVFASELRAIISSDIVPKTFSIDGIATFLAYGAIAQPLTMIEDVRMLEPGSTLEIRTNGSSFRRELHSWWAMPHCSFRGTEQEAITETSRLLHSAVHDHLIADVPVGVFLSAGIDSTLIAAIAEKYCPSVRAFTISIQNEETPDEGEIAAKTAKQLGMDHTAITLQNEQIILSARHWLETTDQPSIDGLNTFVISQAVREHGIKVALSGLGADELFGGYPSFRDVPSLAGFTKLLQWLPARMRRFAGHILGATQTIEARSKIGDMFASGTSIARLTLLRRRLMNDRQMSELGFASVGADTDWLPSEIHNRLPNKESSPGWSISNVESLFYQQNMLLRDSDACSMSHSLELRVPFLDQRLVDFVAALPDSIRFPVKKPRKYLLREAGSEYLSRIHLDRPKTGFTLPLATWMKGSLRTVCEGYLEALKDAQIVEKAGVEKIWNGFLAHPNSNASTRALALVTLGAAVGK